LVIGYTANPITNYYKKETRPQRDESHRGATLNLLVGQIENLPYIALLKSVTGLPVGFYFPRVLRGFLPN
jgi:hypothetical protein